MIIKRPEGITLIPWANGRCLTWDVTVPDMTAASHPECSSLVAGAVAERASKLKISKYLDLTSTCDFVHVSVETIGAWSERVLMFFRTLGKHLIEANGIVSCNSVL